MNSSNQSSKCVICKNKLGETEGEFCTRCSLKYHIEEEETPKFSKIKRKKQED